MLPLVKTLVPPAAILAMVLAARPARADFFDDVRKTFTQDIPRTFQDDVPCAFGGRPTSGQRTTCKKDDPPRRATAHRPPTRPAPRN